MVSCEMWRDLQCILQVSKRGKASDLPYWLRERIVMKKIFRFVGLGGLLTALFAVGAVASFGQDACADVDGQNALYNTFLAKYKGNIDDRKAAVEAGKQFLEKYGACDGTKQITDYLKPKLPALEQGIIDEGIKTKKDALYNRFNTGFKGSNWDEVYASGKEILAL